MKKIIDAVAGDGKNANPARKTAAYALIITAIAFALALVILIASSIAFAVSDKDSGGVVSNGDGDGGDDFSGGSSSALQYETVTEAAFKSKIDTLVEFTKRADREITKGTDNLYYAQNGVSKLSKGTMSSAHDMLLAFYNNNKASLNTDIGANSDNADCTIPLLVNSSTDGLSFKIVVFGNDKTTYQNKTYDWLYNNAYKYGFITNENTFTYVGVAAATYMNSKKIATVDALATALDGKPASVSAATVGTNKSASYQIYYLAAGAELKVPTNYSYTVIADGTKGYIVTVNMAEKLQSTKPASNDGGLG